MTPGTVMLFSVVMGALWLATVPLTSGLVAHIYGLRYMGTLYGIVFFTHQLGGFLGVWLGGRLYDLYGDYTLVWWIGVGVGAFSALVHLPIRETAALLRRPRPEAPSITRRAASRVAQGSATSPLDRRTDAPASRGRTRRRCCRRGHR